MKRLRRGLRNEAMDLVVEVGARTECHPRHSEVSYLVWHIVNDFIELQDAKNQSKLLENTNTTNNQVSNENANNEQVQQLDSRITKVTDLKNQNSDIIGWLEIENTNINYPVLQGDDNEFYMTHNYKKEKSKNGSIFLSKDYNWDIPSSNLLIYGHNNKNGTMFQELLNYEDFNFYKEHPTIRFTTATEDMEFEIISVFKSRVYYKSEQNVFRYYFSINANTKAEYDDFINNAKAASLYDIKKAANYGDQLITLSTCSYHVKDGRFAVVGVYNNTESQ